MLSNKDLYEENTKIEETIEKLANPFERGLLKGINLLLKLLHNIRTNQTAMMAAMGAKKVETKSEGETKQQEER